jgi:hypothetical protein
MSDPTIEGMPYKIALILDGKVEQIFYCSQEDTAKLLSNPTFHEIPEESEVEIGFSFDGNVFSE